MFNQEVKNKSAEWLRWVHVSATVEKKISKTGVMNCLTTSWKYFVDEAIIKLIAAEQLHQVFLLTL